MPPTDGLTKGGYNAPINSKCGARGCTRNRVAFGVVCSHRLCRRRQNPRQRVGLESHQQNRSLRVQKGHRSLLQNWRLTGGQDYGTAPLLLTGTAPLSECSRTRTGACPLVEVLRHWNSSRDPFSLRVRQARTMVARGRTMGEPVDLQIDAQPFPLGMWSKRL